ncbi:MAG: trigger factor family protein, partial [Muribaculaceae bacterium]|nr:trigger factor family protein [Muribaculaceae bacterium]
MNVTLEKTNSTTGKLVVNVVENDYKEKVAAELKKIRRDASIPGFRKGAVPMNIVEKRFRKQVTSDVINQEVYKAVVDYLQENKLDILGEPLPVNVTELDLDKQTDYTFEYELGFAPEINVEINKDITLPYYRIEVTPEMIENEDKALTGRFGTQQPIEVYADRALIKGSIRELGKEEGFVENDNVIVAPWTFKNAEQAAKFEGAKVGDTIVYNPYTAADGNTAELAAMLSITREEAEKLQGDFELKINEITGLKPAEHNEEFFKMAFGPECADEEKYKESLEKSIAAQLLPNSASLFEKTATETLM